MLSKMDGVNSLNNILVIGITNRKDLIDSALLRPGRFEVHVELGLPTEAGRLEIFEIHTAKMHANDILEGDVDLRWLATSTTNYSGAEIEGLVKSAASYALNRISNMETMQAGKRATADEMNDVHVTRDDFLAALDEVKPTFGSEDDIVTESLKGGIINYGPSYAELETKAKMFLDQVRAPDSKTLLMSILLTGERGCGKTAVAAFLAANSGYGFIKMINAFQLLGYSDATRCDRIESAFEQAYKSPISIIVLDDIERLLNYVPIGPRFSNEALQTLMVLLTKAPPNDRRLLIISTSSKPNVLEAMGLMDVFQAKIKVPMLQPSDVAMVLTDQEVCQPQDVEASAAVFDQPIGVKQLLIIIEMARQNAGRSGLLKARVYDIEMGANAVGMLEKNRKAVWRQAAQLQQSAKAPGEDDEQAIFLLEFQARKDLKDSERALADFRASGGGGGGGGFEPA